MLQTLDESGKLIGYTQKSCNQAMNDEGIGKRVVDDLINPIIRWNLGQNSDNISGLTGKNFLMCFLCFPHVLVVE